MAKEIVYRRSFHSDRDFRGMLQPFEFNQASIPDRIIEDGLEAPRNSLDVSTGGFQLQRKVESIYSGVPFGYEFTRSLTSKRRTKEMEMKSHKIPETCRKWDQRGTAPSVVARLMGLDAMPDELYPNANKIAADKRGPTCTSERPQPSQDGSMMRKPGEISVAESLREYADSDERLPCAVRYFREHPQEEQLQEFKKDFGARQALHSMNCQPEEVDARWVNTHDNVRANQLGTCEKFVRSSFQKLNETRDILDTLEFLHSNKDYFMNILRDPNSLFCRQNRHFSPPARHRNSVAYSKAMKTAKHSMESGKEGLHSYFYKTKFNERRHGGLDQHKQEERLQNAKLPPSNWMSPRKTRLQPKEDMPICRRGYVRENPLPGKIADNGCSIKNQMPTRIVILKPSHKGHPSSKSASLSSPSPRANVSTNEGNKILRDAKERVKYSNQELKRESHIRKEMTKIQLSTHGLTDPREIAKEIVQKVKDKVSRKLSKEAFRSRDILNLKANSSDRRLSPEQPVISRNDTLGGINDRGGSCRVSRMFSKDQHKLQSSLPNLSPFDRFAEPCLASEERRLVLNNIETMEGPQKEDNLNAINLTQKNEALHKVQKSCTRLRDAAQSPRNLNKRCPDSVLHTPALSAPCTTLDNSKGDGFSSSKTSRKDQEKSNSSIVSNSRISSPRTFSGPRSVANEYNSIDRVLQERMNTTSDGNKLTDGSFSTENISSLKESFSQAKKKANRKASTLVEENPRADSLVSADVVEITIPRHLNSHQLHCKETGNDSATHLNVFEGSSMQQTDCSLIPSEHLLTQTALARRSLTGRMVESHPVLIDLPEWMSGTCSVNSASETRLEKSEQPSPISVLESPFQEQSPSHVNFQEIDPNLDNLNELQLKWCLHLDDVKTEHGSKFYGVQETSFNSPIITHSQIGFSPFDKIICACDGSCNKPTDYFSVHDRPCFSRQVDLTYIRDILVFSGFDRHDTFLVKSFSLEHGLDPSIFLRLEDRYNKCNGSQMQSFGVKGNQVPNALERRLLFDIVDEIIHTKLGMPAYYHPWVRTNKLTIHCTQTGRQLIQIIWAEVGKYFSLDQESKDHTLEDLAAKALSGNSSWVASQLEVERIISELGEGILNTLVEEAVLELFS